MLQRILITCVVQLFDYPVHRLLVAALVTVAYMALLALLEPYKRKDLNVLGALGVQFTMFVIFVCSLLYRLFEDIETRASMELAIDLIGFSSKDDIVNLIMACIAVSLLVFVAVIVVQAFSKISSAIIHLVDTKQPPEMDLAKGMRYQLFLSHIWSSGQGECLRELCVWPHTTLFVSPPRASPCAHRSSRDHQTPAVSSSARRQNLPRVSLH